MLDFSEQCDIKLYCSTINHALVIHVSVHTQYSSNTYHASPSFLLKPRSTFDEYSSF